MAKNEFKRFEINYITDSNRMNRRKVMRANSPHEAEQKFMRMMKAMNICECQFEILSIEEI